MESKTILFTVDGDSISPRTEQKAGVQGNHNITEVRFNVEEALVSGALGDSPTSRIRMQFIDGAGGFYSTGFLDVMSEILPDESAQYYVTCPIPNNVTNAGGLAYVYLVVTEIAYEGEKALESQVYISPPGKLLYTHSGVGSPSEYAYKVGITNALVNAEIFAGQAERYSNEAKNAESNSAKSESAAATSAAAALISENNAKAFESAADESAKNARKSENNAGASAEDAETSETNASNSATNARLSANAAENSATAARQDSDLAKKYRNDTKTMFENFNGIQLWQPNTEYKVGDVVIATWENEDKEETVIAKCNEVHTSSASFTNDLVVSAVWDMKSINAYGDEYGRNIYNTYATKEELEEALENIPTGEGGTITVDQTYNPESENAQSGIAVAEAVAGVKYFNITQSGVVSLKSEYQNSEFLPENLIIPDNIKGIEVTSLSDGMFENNSRIVTVTLPTTITAIPQNCFKNTIHLLRVLNTENIVNVGTEAFHTSHIEKIKLPSLQELGISAFYVCPYLEIVDIGRVTKIPTKAFRGCENLKEIVYSGTITSVGDYAFYLALALKEIGFANTLTSIGKSAFFKCGVRFDWSTLVGCTFGEYATPYQFVNGLTSAEYGKSGIPYQNPVVKPVCQSDVRWIGEPINSNKTFGDGCLYFAVMSAYCGLHNRPYINAFELNQMNNAISDTQLELFTNEWGSQDIITWLENLGFVADIRCTANGNHMQDISGYDEIKSHLRKGGYCVLSIPSSPDFNFNGGAHAILLYGINEYDEVLYVNSSSVTRYFDKPMGTMGSCLLQNFMTITETYYSTFMLLTPITEKVNLPLIDKRIDSKINSATGTFTPTEDTSKIAVNGLNFRPTEITVMASIPADADNTQKINILVNMFDEVKEPIGKYGAMSWYENGTQKFTLMGTHNTFEIYNDGFSFERSGYIFKSGYTYTWFATGKRDTIAESCFILNDDAETVTIDFGNLNPKTITVFAESGTPTIPEGLYMITHCTLNKPTETEGVTNDCNIIAASIDYNGDRFSTQNNHKEWSALLQDGHYKLQLSTTELMNSSVYRFAKNVLYRWIAIS